VLNPSRSRLALVPEPQIGLDAKEKEHGGDHAGHRSSSDRIPFCIQVTMEQVLKVADDADLRAQMLEWSLNDVPDGAQALRRVGCLHQVAIDLRRITATLEDGW